MFRILPVIAAALCATGFLVPEDARADIYAFTDERGVRHFTNVPGLDKRYKLVRREGRPAPQFGPMPARMPSEEDIRRYSAIVDAVSRIHGVDDALVHAVISAESGYNATAVSRKGASGLMQLMPDTARRYGVEKIFNPVDNIYGGVRYLKDLLAMFNGDIRLALAGYNAGENAVIRAGHRIPPYPETEQYVPRVLEYYKKFQARKG
jgi:hypothetical protein